MSWKNFSYTKKGVIIGLIAFSAILFIMFIFFWIQGTNYILDQKDRYYEQFLSCESCGEDIALFECAINVCSAKYNIDCKDDFDERIDSIIKLNNITDQKKIDKIIIDEKDEVIHQHCAIRGSKGDYEYAATTQPNFLKIFFSSGIGKGYEGFLMFIVYGFPFILLGSIIFTVIGAVIGRKIGKIKSKKME